MISQERTIHLAFRMIFFRYESYLRSHSNHLPSISLKLIPLPIGSQISRALANLLSSFALYHLHTSYSLACVVLASALTSAIVLICLYLVWRSPLYYAATSTFKYSTIVLRYAFLRSFSLSYLMKAPTSGTFVKFRRDHITPYRPYRRVEADVRFATTVHDILITDCLSHYRQFQYISNQLLLLNHWTST